jgi:hypothetical protein
MTANITLEWSDSPSQRESYRIEFSGTTRRAEVLMAPVQAGESDDKICTVEAWTVAESATVVEL